VGLWADNLFDSIKTTPMEELILFKCSIGTPEAIYDYLKTNSTLKKLSLGLEKFLFFSLG